MQTKLLIRWNEDSKIRSCPKCQGEQSEESLACAECGLLTDNFERFAAEDASSEVSPELDELARTLAANTRDQQRHEAFIARAIDEDELVFLARWYRAALTRNPEHRLFKSQLARVQSMAQASLGLAMSRTAPAGKGPYRGALLLFAILFTMVGGAVMLTQAQVSKRHNDPIVETQLPTNARLAVDRLAVSR